MGKKTQFFIKIFMILLGSVIMAVNINTLTNSGGLLPGGFTGVTLLLQEIILNKFGVKIPFSTFIWIMNIIPAIVCYKYVGKKFTIYSCVVIVLASLLTDIIPSYTFTNDILLCAIFGGILNGIAMSCFLQVGATSGGTDFIAMFISHKTGKDAWNFILMGNVVVLLIAGILFGWNKALYSIIYQYASTQVLNILYKKYQKTTVLIITQKHEEVYQVIHQVSNHGATVFDGKGCYNNSDKKLLYTVISSAEENDVIKAIRKVDPDSFINCLETKNLYGKFFFRPTE